MGLIMMNDGSQKSDRGDEKKFLEDLLIKKAEELRRIPSFDDVRYDPKMPNPNNYAGRYWGKDYTTAAQKICQKVPATWEPEELEPDVSEDSEGVSGGSDGAGSSGSSGGAGWHKPYTTEEIVAKVRGFFLKQGRFPTDEEILTLSDFPTPQTIRTHLGPRTNWADALGVVAAKDDEAVRRSKRYTDEDIFRALQKCLEKNGRFPYQAEYEKYGLPTHDVLTKRLGRKEYWVGWYLKRLEESSSD